MSLELAYAHVEAQRRLRAGTLRAAIDLWRQLRAYNAPDIVPFLAVLIPLLIGSQTTAIALVNAYLAREVGREPLPLDTSGIIRDLRGPDVDLEEVYRRPFVTVWSALRDQTRWEQAVGEGLTRLTTLIETDLQLAMRDAVADVTEQDDAIVGYRRVPNPDACPLCLIASTQRYHRGDLLPIHQRCQCGVVPIIGASDPGRVIDPELLASLKASGETADLSYTQAIARARKRGQTERAEALKRDRDSVRAARRAQRQADIYAATAIRYAHDQAAATGVRIRTEQHGELGPVLVNAAHNFTPEPTPA